MKRKKVTLTLSDKINIIESLKKGEPARKLADKYGIGISTISDIKRNADTILEYARQSEANKRRRAMKKPKNELLEKVLYSWYLEKLSTGQSVTGALLCNKALELNRNIGGSESFVASNGWLHKFKTRHGIHCKTYRTKPIHKNLIKISQEPDEEETETMGHLENETEGNFESENETGVSVEIKQEIEQKAEDEVKYETVYLQIERNAEPSHAEGFHALDMAVKWYKNQTECDPEKMLQLKQIRDLAAEKKKEGLRQMRITNYFSSIS